MSPVLQHSIRQAWRKKNLFFYALLLPLSWIFTLVIWLRRKAYQSGYLKSYALSVPVIVVGNINVGGSGKTPVVIWLISQLQQLGWQPGIVSRGYGGTHQVPTAVLADSAAQSVGDEPVLMAMRCDCPVWVGADRVAAGRALLAAHPDCNVVVCDDGLQHYRLQRTVEIAVVDAETVQSRRLLPAGPLREPIERLATVDAVISNETLYPASFAMHLSGQRFYNLHMPDAWATAADFRGKSITAIAGIGKPERFFAHLMKLGLTFVAKPFADHHQYSAEDIATMTGDVILMTEKDAVKCRALAQARCWVLPVEAFIDAALLPIIDEKIRRAIL